MSINKNALVRYKVLDKCFRNIGRKYFLDDLIDECNQVLQTIDPNSKGISRRQMFEDIAFMESEAGWSVDLEKLRIGKKVYYRYRDTRFSINNMPLTEIEVTQLKSAVSILQQFKGMPQFEWMDDLVEKLQIGYSLSSSNKVIDFDANQYLRGIENIGILHNAIIYRKPLLISYRPFDADSSYEIEIHPYYLKQYNNRWFLFGYNPERSKFDWNLAVDRIVAVSELQKGFVANTEIDWSEYFEDIIGVTKPEGGVEDVILHCFGKTTKYIETKPLHGSQKSKHIDDRIVEVSLKVIVNFELEREIIAYGDGVQVVSPPALVNSIREKLNKSLERYLSSAEPLHKSV
jgi:predicted DNA-binding transcriptional regulator YafY